jgi:hypothetical protein
VMPGNYNRVEPWSVHSSPSDGKLPADMYRIRLHFQKSPIRLMTALQMQEIDFL